MNARWLLRNDNYFQALLQARPDGWEDPRIKNEDIWEVEDGLSERAPLTQSFGPAPQLTVNINCDRKSRGEDS